MSRGKVALVAGVGAAALWFALGEQDANAKPLPPEVDCGSDSECLGKRFALSAVSKVGTVVSAARLSSVSPLGTPTGAGWVAARRAEGLVVVSSDEHLLEGTVLLAVYPKDAAEITRDGAFRVVG